MKDTLQKTSLLAALALAATLGACQPGADESDPADSTEDALAGTNGLSMINGLSMVNGLTMKAGLVQALNASGLTATTIFLLVFDALSPTYALDPVVLGILIGGIATLLGLAGWDRVNRQ